MTVDINIVIILKVILMEMRDIINLIQEDYHPNIGYHVTDAISAEAIMREGFLGGWGDVGFGVYFWQSLDRAKAYVAKGGWDGRLADPVIIEVKDPGLQLIDPNVIHPDWDAELYAAMLWKPMDEDDPDAPWQPSSMRIVE